MTNWQKVGILGVLLGLCASNMLGQILYLGIIVLELWILEVINWTFMIYYIALLVTVLVLMVGEPTSNDKSSD
jgi:hypothetical protein